MSTSADLFVAGPKGEADWMFKLTDEESTNWTLQLIKKAGVHIMGSRTFRDMASYWPYSPDPIAEPMNRIPKIAFSKEGFDISDTKKMSSQALKDSNDYDKSRGMVNNVKTPYMSTWENATVATGDLAEEIKKLKSQDGDFILAHGGANFAQSLAQTGLIDEYHLLVHPVFLGKGLPIFSAIAKPLFVKLTDLKVLKSGVTGNIYLPA
jgi:dihydrofolate reductase